MSVNYPVLKPNEVDAIARALLQILDAPRRKSDMPIKPMISEFIGKSKAGKDKQLVNMDRCMKRRRLQVLVHQEGAESEAVRVVPRDFSFAMQLTYLTQALDRMLHAAVSRDFHMIFFNRGVLDTLYWFEFQLRKGSITRAQYDTAVNFIMQGPWIEALDTVICLNVSVERALEREYGADFRSRDIKFGSMMSPEGLTLMSECVDHVCEMLKNEHPSLPLFIVDTTDQTERETEEHITSILFSEFQKRLKIGEDHILPWSIDLMRERAWVAGPEIKLRGTLSHEVLRKNGWHLEASVFENDEYIVPKGQNFRTEECFHIRTSGDSTYLVYKGNFPALRRPKIPVPITEDNAAELIRAFDPVAIIRKSREIFTKDGLILHKDRVEGLGDFIEIKGRMATTDMELMEEARKLGFPPDALVPETYVRLKLAQNPAH